MTMCGNNTRIQNLIPKTDLFGELSEDQQSEIVSIVSIRNVERGEIVFSEGDEGLGFYVLLSGRVRIFKLSPDGKEQVLHFPECGDSFGEVPVFSGGNFPAHAQAMKKSELLFFPREAFIQLIQKDPSLALSMLAMLSKRLRRFAQMVESLSLREVPGRLASYLIQLSRQDQTNANQATTTVHLDVPKSQLASLLGTIPETLSRIFARMTREGLIESAEGNAVIILDFHGLQELADGERRLA